MTFLQVNTTACDGSDVFWIWLLWLLIAFILGIILGSLFKKGGKNSSTEVAATSAASGAGSKQDLTKVEGIGPKIEKLLNDAGIINFHQLSQTSHDELKRILHEAGPAFTVHQPITWSAQARLADENQWGELEKWQELLKGGI